MDHPYVYYNRPVYMYYIIWPFAGKCGNGSTVHTQNCECSEATASPQSVTTSKPPLKLEWIIIIGLAAVLVFVIAAGMLYGAWNNKKAKEAMERQVRTVASINTQSAFSLPSTPVVAIQQQQRTNFYPNSLYPVTARSTERRPDQPLPITPLEVINNTYESIEALHLHEHPIEPYAATRFRLSAQENFEEMTTIVQTYQTYRDDSVSEGYYVRTPPPVPEPKDFLREKYGYLVATATEKKKEQEISGRNQGRRISIVQLLQWCRIDENKLSSYTEDRVDIKFSTH